MKKISELGLELIELGDQVLLVNKELTLSNNGEHYIPYGSKKGNIHKWDMEGMHEGKQVWINKIITSTKTLEGLPLLVIEDEVEELSKTKFKSEIMRRGFVSGYNKAKETYVKEIEIYQRIIKDLLDIIDGNE